MAQKGAKVTEETAEFLFNLASVDRLILLSEIKARKQRLTTLSKAINASPQECSRHLARLSNAGFIKKDSEGFYESTTLGNAVQSLFPSIEFVLKHKNYFLSHDLSPLPNSFIERIGELSSTDYVNHVSQVLELIKTTISAAREYVWLISDQPIVVGVIGTSFYSRDMPVRLIAEPTIDRKIVAETKAALTYSELAVVPEVKIAMAINEKSAGVCFPGLNKEIDFSSGFAGKDPRFRAWCSELFEYYWVKARKI